MSSFSDHALEEKLNGISNSQQSIQTMSLWLIHHRKHAGTIVKVWYRELQKVKPSKKLTCMYLANDVIQNSRRKGTEFTTAFSSVLDLAFKHVASHSEDAVIKSLDRILNIWRERGVYEADYVEILKRALGTSSSNHHPHTPKKKRKIELPVEEELEDELSQSPREPPDPEELVKALKELEQSASSDAGVREKIASLPQEVQDATLLDKITNKESAERLSKMVDDACLLLAEYNGRLAAELEDRKQVSRMLADFIAGQKEKLAASELKLETYKEKLAKVTRVRKELKSHLQNLPDLTLLPDVTGGLAPLPSAGDLFQ
ncbi:regulation of nuclear pre-mRNA domain-containing protein 1B-like [Saccoglossus kowalevskii]|uniref:Regulation of nuclear pre-mRNA domain-containing protein 1B-like n=1 Tax=Saccoglossus kowalevskii TaxID=10224 RepID=A0ABM0MWJ3_SACKO|nr:PREDICTED: regulation of nuclear pre-mRNA domain-containing protein 1B-like [Saccoglossus kowalevskii]